MRTAVRYLTLVLLVMLAPGAARAGPSIANPRHADPSPDVFDSTKVARFEWGVLLGTPAGLNAEIGWWTQPSWGMRASGLFLGGGAGIQASLCRTIRRSAARRTAVALVAGTMHSEGTAEWTYAGAAIDWNLHGLFLETGLVYGDGELEFGGDRIESGVQLIAQLGFLSGGGVHGPR